MKKVLTGVAKFCKEDGGCALIAEISDGSHDGLFIRIHSWDENHKHATANLLDGKEVMITIETI